MKPQVIYEAPPLQLTVSSTASAATVALLEQTVYGTTGPQYAHTGQANKASHLTGPYFFELWRGGQLVGTYCLSKRLVHTPTGTVPGFYGRYLAVAAASQGRGYGRLLKQQAVQFVERTRPWPHVFYSYIEANNARSLRISQAEGFQSLATLEAFSFGRLYPRPDPRVSQLAPADLPALLAQLAVAHESHTLVQFNHVYDGQHYFVLRENGAIVAGVQANPTQWRITHMPGVSGWLLLHALPYVPVLRRLINPQAYRFAALEAIYVQPGHEPALLALLESVLAHFKFTSALLLLDLRDPLSTWLRSTGQLGLLQRLKQPVHTRLMAKLNGLTEAQVLGMPLHPVYTSAFDYT